MKPENKVSLARVVNATRYSIQGLKSAYLHEAAFRLEMWLATALLPLGLYLGEGAIEKILLAGSVLLVLLVELLNSAVEAAIDRFGEDYHELSGRAKDMGSAAVLIAMLLFALSWGLILFT